MSAVALLRELTSVPTAPYFERAVAARALRWIKDHLGKRVGVRRARGGVIVSYRGAGPGPALAYAAHLDHPAFHIVRSGPAEALARLQGGLPPHLLPGERVEAFPAVPKDNRPLASGRLGKPGKDGLYPISWETPPRSRPDFAVLALKPCAVEGRWLLSRSIDDLLGCAVSLEALRRLAAAHAKTNLIVLLHRAEEVGFMGALGLIHERQVGPEVSVVSVESSRELPGARPGRGPVIRLGDKACLFDPNLTALLDDAAARLKKRGTLSQRLRLTGGTCEATVYQAFGYEAGGLAVPLVNYHNGWGAKKIAEEKVRLEDVDGAVRLLVEAARLFPRHSSARGTLRTRLSRRYAGNSRKLEA